MTVNRNKNENNYTFQNNYTIQNKHCHNDLYIISAGAIKLKKTKLKENICECLISRENDLTFLWFDELKKPRSDSRTLPYLVKTGYGYNPQIRHHAAGRVFLTYPGARYSLHEKCLQTGQNLILKDMLCHQLTFSSSYLNALSLNLIGRPADTFIGQSISSCREFRSIIKQIEKEKINCLPGSSFMIRNLGAQLAIALIRHFARSVAPDIGQLSAVAEHSACLLSEGKDASLAGRMCEIAAYISQHCSQKISNERLARRFKINSSYLSRCFSQTFNQTITEYKINCRIEMAIKLMHNENRSITQIARLCGYQSVSRFSDRFKLVTGLAPTEYRLQLYQHQMVKPE